MQLAVPATQFWPISHSAREKGEPTQILPSSCVKQAAEIGSLIKE